MRITKLARGLVSAAALGVALAAPAGAEDKSFANTGEWAKAFTNPAFMEGMTRMMSPEMMQAWMQVMFNPDMVNAMMSSMGDMMDPALFQQWWVPKSADLKLISCEMDVRTGGSYRLVFAHPLAEQPMAFFGRYLEVITNECIVWTNDESDQGAVTTVR